MEQAEAFGLLIAEYGQLSHEQVVDTYNELTERRRELLELVERIELGRTALIKLLLPEQETA